MKISVIILLLSVVVLSVVGLVILVGSGAGSVEDNICKGEHNWEFSHLDTDTFDGDRLIYECSECHETKSIGADEVEHKLVIENVLDSGDCQTVMNAVFKCSVCGWTKIMEGYFGDHVWTGSSSAYCGEEGHFERTCTVCGESESGSTEGLGHDLRYSTDEESENRYEYCTRCAYTTGGAD